MAGIFDTHCHLMAEEYEKDDMSNILEEAKMSGVSKICNVGYDMESSEKAVRQAFEYDNVFAIVGIHPTNVAKYEDNVIDKLEEYANSGRVVGIGEVGLDYYYKSVSKEVQKAWFIKQIKLAQKCDLPLSVHCRDAYEDCFDIMLNNNVNHGVMHCYLGNVAMAQKIMDLGLYVSFGGIVTFRNAKDVQEVAKVVPLRRMVLETDAPYLTPEPYRGDKNYPKYTVYVARKIAEIKNITVDEVIRVTCNNSNTLFNIR